MTPELGENTIFYIEVITSSGTQIVPICAVTDFGIDINNDLTEITPDSRWKDYIYGLFDYNISISGIVKIPDSDVQERLIALADGRLLTLLDGNNVAIKGLSVSDWGDYGFYDILTLFMRLNYINWFNWSDYSDVKWSGTAAINKMSYNSNMNDVSKWSCTLQGKGGITLSVLPAPVVKSRTQPTKVTHTSPLTWTTVATGSYTLSGTPVVGDVVKISFKIKNNILGNTLYNRHEVVSGDTITTILADLSAKFNNSLADLNTRLLYSASVSGNTITIDYTNGTSSGMAPYVDLADIITFTVTLTPYVGSKGYTAKVINADTQEITYIAQTSNVFSFNIPNANYLIAFNSTTQRFDTKYSDNLIIDKING